MSVCNHHSEVCKGHSAIMIYVRYWRLIKCIDGDKHDRMFIYRLAILIHTIL